MKRFSAGLSLLVPILVGFVALGWSGAAADPSTATPATKPSVGVGASESGASTPDQAPPTRPPRLVVAVLPFQNATGDPAADDWRNAVAALVRLCLGRAEFTRTPGWQTIQTTLERSGWTNGTPMDIALARKAAGEAKAKVVVWGALRRQEDRWAAEAKVLRPAADSVPAEVQVAATNWVDLAESLSLRLAAQLGRHVSDEERRIWRLTVPSSDQGATAFAKAINLEIQGAPATERESAWREVIAADPFCGMAHGSLVRLLGEAERKSDCEKAAAEFLRRQPEFCYAHLVNAWVLALNGQMTAAEAALRVALRFHPGCPEAMEGLFDLLAGQARWAELIAVVNEASTARPDDEANRAYLAAALSQSGRLSEAREALAAFDELPEEDDTVDLALLQAGLAVGRIELAGLELQRLGPRAATNETIRNSLDSARITIRPPPDGATNPPIVPPRAFTVAELNDELDRRLTPEERKLVVNPIEVTTALAVEARRLTAGLTNDALRSFALFAEVTRRGRGTGDGGTRTAGEALQDARDPETRFSCQEHAKLFVALARAVGLDAWLTHIERCADGTPAYHDCAALFLNGEGLLVDATWGVFGVRHQEFVVLDDLQAISHQAMQPQPKSTPPALRAGLKLNPDDRWTRLQFVRGMARTGEFEAADDVLRLVQSGGADTWDVHDAVAVVAAARSQWRPALAELQRAAALSPSNAVVHLRLAGVYAELGEMAKSAEHMQTALSLNRGEISNDLRREHLFSLQVLDAFSQAKANTSDSLAALRRKAEAGDLPAQMGMAKACFDAQPPRTEEGMNWLKKAVEQGDAQAQFHYARNLVLLRGQSAVKEALQWLGRSADQGFDEAQYQLGLIYYEGDLASRDHVAGAQWICLAADQGHVEARRLLKEMQIMLRPAELTEGRQRADAFKPVKPRATGAAR